jgi:hypothetical protein
VATTAWLSLPCFGIDSSAARTCHACRHAGLLSQLKKHRDSVAFESGRAVTCPSDVTVLSPVMSVLMRAGEAGIAMATLHNHTLVRSFPDKGRRGREIVALTGAKTIDAVACYGQHTPIGHPMTQDFPQVPEEIERTKDERVKHARLASE